MILSNSDHDFDGDKMVEIYGSPAAEDARANIRSAVDALSLFDGDMV